MLVFKSVSNTLLLELLEVFYKSNEKDLGC